MKITKDARWSRYEKGSVSYTYGVSRSPKETFDIGRNLASKIRENDVIGLVGDLGSGKTSLAKGIAAGLHLNPETVTSPTYTIIHSHPPQKMDNLGLNHVDLYRISPSAAVDEMATIGLDEAIDVPRTVTVIEWIDRLGNDFIFPENASAPFLSFCVEISVIDEQSRGVAIMAWHPQLTCKGCQ